MSKRVLCRPGMHAPPAATLLPDGKAYVLNREREYWVDAALVEENDYWVPVEPTPEPTEPPTSDSDGDESEPNHSPSQTTDAAETAAQEPERFVCGAAKSNGEPCQRAVDDANDHCWQHEE